VKSRNLPVGESVTDMAVADLVKEVSEELPIVAELIGDETEKLDITIDDIISKNISGVVQQEIDILQETTLDLKKKVVSPPYDPLKLALMLEINTRLMRACHLRARNTIGLGWAIQPVPADPDEEQAPAINQKEYSRQKKLLKKLYSDPTPNAGMMPGSVSTPLDFSEVSYRMKVDEESTGTGYYEITRDNKGEIDGIYNIPAHTVRALNSGGFVQIRGRKKKFFKRFGDIRVVSSESGEQESNLSIEKRATELLPNLIYSSRSSFYGIPRWISAVAAVQGSRLAAVRNMAFFENDAVGRMAIVVSGGALTQQSVQDIRTFVNREGKGVEKAHRVMVLQAEPRRVISSKGVGTKIDVVPLTVGISEDASFGTYRSANDEEVREASGLSSPFFTSEGVNRACLVGDTRLPLLDGRTLTMRELADEHADEKFWVYACDGSRIVPGYAHSPRKMRDDAQLVEVLLDNGESIKCTPDHLFMLRDGSYKEAQKLSFGDRLMPFRQKIPTSGFNMGHRFYKMLTKGWETVHAMVARESFGYAPSADTVIHHRDLNKLNNVPDNLTAETPSSHAAIHMAQRMENEEFCRKAEEARKAGWARWAAENPEKVSQIARTASDALREKWADDEFRERMIKIFCEARSSDDCRRAFVQRMRPIITSPEFVLRLTDRVRALWKSPAFREKQRAAVSNAVKDRWSTYEDEKSRALQPMRDARRNDDVTFAQICCAAARSSSWKELCGAVGASRSRVVRILRDNDTTYENLKRDNHRVVSVSDAGTADVYDITVDDYHNFATMAGVFVHNSANVLRKITIEQDLIPDLRSHQHVLNRTVSKDVLTASLSAAQLGRFQPIAELRYLPPASVDELEEAQIQGMYARSGIVTINEARLKLGLKALPPDFVYGQLPLPMALSLLEMGLLYQGAITSDGVESYDATVAAAQEQARVAAEAKATATASAKSASSEGAPPPPAGASAQKSLYSSESTKRLDKINEMTGMATRLRHFLKEKLGRDMISAEIIFQNRAGETVDRISLGDLSDEEDSNE